MDTWKGKKHTHTWVHKDSKGTRKTHICHIWYIIVTWTHFPCQSHCFLHFTWTRLVGPARSLKNTQSGQTERCRKGQKPLWKQKNILVKPLNDDENQRTQNKACWTAPPSDRFLAQDGSRRGCCREIIRCCEERCSFQAVVVGKSFG